jgi:NadR type nicotinamide-nucleotide adenylyltransferase
MKPYRTGVIAGKFCPLHRGHQYLIETALAQCEELYLLICWNPRQRLPVARRLAWLRELYPQVHALTAYDLPADDDSHGWAAYTRQMLGFAPDAVFTSESYGDAYAAHLGAVHVQVDLARLTVPCSGTQVRGDPLGHLADLAPCVRAWYVPRIVLVGAESTGKTTLAEELARHYGTVWMPEYGREYWEQKLLAGTAQQWTAAEFLHIASEHARREDSLARTAAPPLIVDTDAFATAIWHRRYLQDQRSAAVERLAAERRPLYALYLLTAPDFPFVQDGTRDGEAIRDWMHQTFVAELRATHRPWLLLTGAPHQRRAAAIAAINAALASPVRETSP